MKKYLPLAALLLAGCTATGQPRVGAIIGGVLAGAALIATTSEDDDDKQCTTVIGPGSGIGNQTTTCR